MSTADWKQEWLNLNAAASIMGQYIGELDAEVNRLREAIKVAKNCLEEPKMLEETRKDLLIMLKEMIE